MIVGEGTGSFNPNHSWLNAKGTWATYIVITIILHLLFFVNPWLSAAWAWTLTNTIHNVGNFLLLHMTKGTPWMPMDEGKARYLTQWEQLDRGMQFTATKKFLTVMPIVLSSWLAFSPSMTPTISYLIPSRYFSSFYPSCRSFTEFASLELTNIELVNTD